MCWFPLGFITFIATLNPRASQPGSPLSSRHFSVLELRIAPGLTLAIYPPLLSLRRWAGYKFTHLKFQEYLSSARAYDMLPVLYLYILRSSQNNLNPCLARFSVIHPPFLFFM